MKKSLFAKIMAATLACLLPWGAFSQMQSSVVRMAPPHFTGLSKAQTINSVEHGYQAPREIPFSPQGAFLAYSLAWFSPAPLDDNRLFISFSKNGVIWDGLLKIEPDIHADPLPGRTISQLYFAEKGYRYFRLLVPGWPQIDSLAVRFFDPGPSRPEAAEQVLDGIGSEACPCPQPGFMGRNDWCPSGNCPPDASPEFTVADHLIIHHSAGVNTSSDWAGVVRSIWDFHVNVNGWDDIGYNWLIDPNGVLYEGRGDGRLGAHFCGKNGGTVGVCVMGDFTTIVPTYSAVDKLVSLYSWNACSRGIDPLGTSFHAASGLNLPNIAGHRDGCSTSCPGDGFYPLLPEVRLAIQDRIENVCFGVAAADESSLGQDIQIFPNPTAGPIQVLVKNAGTGNVGLILTDAVGRPVSLSSSLDGNNQTGKFELQMEDLPQGLYWLKVLRGADFTIHKIVKQP